ncbi:MAG: FecR family protein [bacterium]|nr:FecR family protein [bacterium]
MNRILPILLIALLLPLSAWAQSVGFVQLTSGRLKVFSDQGFKILDQPNQTLQVSADDQIQTAQDSRATLYLTQYGNAVQLYSLSIMRVQKADPGQTLLQVPAGKAYFKVDPLKNRAPFRVRTTNAMVGVKGTEFVVETDSRRTNLLTLKGKVTFEALNRAAQAISVSADFASQVMETALPLTPVAVPPDQIDSILKADTNAGWDVPGLSSGEPAPGAKKNGFQAEKARAQVDDPLAEVSSESTGSSYSSGPQASPVITWTITVE